MKMKINILSSEGKEAGKIDLPAQFNEEFRPDLIKRAVLVIRSNKRHSYGALPDAGKRQSAELSRRRKDYKGAYGHGISRVPRKIVSRRGTRMNWIAAFAPGTVGGRRAHPPKASKIWSRKINNKERRKAIRSALGAVINANIVSARGHLIPKTYPFVIETKTESISKSKEFINVLKLLNLENELARVKEPKIRAGKGKMRGRKYKSKIGPLIVVSEKCSLIKAGNNIPGIEVVEVSRINAELLAPGTLPGRLTLFTEKAVQEIGRKKLFE